MELTKTELVAKLDKISALYKDTVAIQSKMDEFVPEDHYKREITVPAFPGNFNSEEERAVWTDKLDHANPDAPAIAEHAHRQFYGPKEPEKPEEEDFKRPVNQALQNKQSKFGVLSKIFAGVSVFFLLGTLLNLNDEYSVLPTLIIITLAAAAAFLFFGYKAKLAKAEEEKYVAEALAKHNRQQETRKAEYAQKMKSYEQACAAYETDLKSFMESYNSWRAIYLQSLQEEAQIAEKLEADRAAAVNSIYNEQYVPAEAALKDCNDLVSQEYLPVLHIITDLIRSNRADGLKEAINLYEDLVYRERQLQLQREQEEQRRHEEALRRQDEERRYLEEKSFRENQERQRQREAEARRRDEERHHQEAMNRQAQQARDEQRRREQERRDQKRCVWCAHKSTCRQQYYDGAYNCTGFTPKK